MIKRSLQLATLGALLVLGIAAAPWAGSQTGDEWLHGEQCSTDGQGPVLCMEQPQL